MMRIIQDRAEIEPDIHMGPERRDVTERKVADARRGLAIVKKFQHVGTTRPHVLEPPRRNIAKLPRQRREPVPDGRIAPLRAIEREVPCVGHVRKNPVCGTTPNLRRAPRPPKLDARRQRSVADATDLRVP